MKKLVTIGTLALCAVAGAQETVQPRRVEVFNRAVAGPGDKAQFVASEFGWREQLVKGMPYSADAVTETTQTFADGNKISRKNTTHIYRDSEGRTRREETLNAVGPWASGTPHKLIFINDPVAQVHWALDPQRKEARKMSRTITVKRSDHEAGFAEIKDSVEDVTIQVQGSMVAGEPAAGKRARMAFPPHAEAVMTAPIGAVGGAIAAEPLMMMRTGDDKNVKTEPLGKRAFEGVEAEGTKTTFTIPAGQIGNERPIVSENEHWFSNELKTTVLTRRSDPRQGETTYKLTNIRRGEPDSALFQPPADYKVIESGSQVIQLDQHTK